MMYMAHFAWALEIIVIAAGFVALYFAANKRSGHLKNAAWILIIGGAASLGCNIYYTLTYAQQGLFATPELAHQMNIMPMHNAPMQQPR